MSATLQSVAPELVLIALASLVYLAGTFAKPGDCWPWVAVAVLGITGATLAASWALNPPPPSAAAESGSGVVNDRIGSAGPRLPVVNDALARYGAVLALLTGLALVLLSVREAGDDAAPEYFASLLLVVAGLMLAAAATELILLFLALELISIPIYVMLYLPRRDAAAQEAAAKYFFLSVFSSAVFLYGLSFVYGAVGSTYLNDIAAHQVDTVHDKALLVAVAFLLAGLGFKVAAVPFHFYAPDVFQGTTDTLAALLAWVPKAAGFLAILRLVTASLASLGDRTAWLVWILAAATMTTGNALGVLQNNVRRLLAYSSIAHAGYMLIGIGVASLGGSAYLTASGADSVLFYLLAYAAMTLGVFAVVVSVSTRERPVQTVDDLAGLARTRPGAAFAMAIFLFSLTGIPLTAGFWGKFMIFSSAIASGDSRYTWLAVVGVVNAAISSYYYLRIIGVMYMQESYAPVAPRTGRNPAFGVAVACAIVTLGVGLFPAPFLGWARRAGANVQAAVVQTSAGAPGLSQDAVRAAAHLN